MVGLNAAELATFYADYIDRWNRRDLESYYSLYAPDLVFRDGSAVLHGLDALRDRYEAELRDHPDLTMECLRLFVDPESQSMAAENIERGTNIELRGALFLTLDPEGRISEVAEYLNSGNTCV
ncbi:MAG TPA: nuclear transport factor 2 family protein [Solirubrobacterales bacterium]|nr:nuclear transport factor 2 family protein [Solirubrobacterales bacterium]